MNDTTRSDSVIGKIFSVSGKIFIFFLVSALFLWAVNECWKRINSENANKIVEFCLDWDEALQLAQSQNYPVSDLFARAKAIGVTSIAVNEETLDSYIRDASILYFTPGEYQKFKLLELTSPGSPLNSGTLLIKDTLLTDQVLLAFKERYAINFSRSRAGKYQLITPAAATFSSYKGRIEDLSIGFSKGKIDTIRAYGFNIVLKPVNSGNPAWFNYLNFDGISGFLFDGKEVPGFLGKESIFIDAVQKRIISSTITVLNANIFKPKFIVMEFINSPGQDALLRSVPASIVRGHTISPNEMMKSYKPDAWIARWNRAVSERSIRFAYFHFYPMKSIDENFDYLRTTAKQMKKHGFILTNAVPPYLPERGSNNLWLNCALLCALIFPVIAIYYAKKIVRPLAAFFLANAISLFGGLLIASLLYDVVFMQKLIEIPHVKLLLLLPILLSLFVVFEPGQIKLYWNLRIRMKHAVLAAVLLAGALIFMSRSSNNSVYVMQAELKGRASLENIFSIRPRTKEFLIGQPLLFLGLALKNPLLIVIGTVGQVSIINTFLHAHSPLLLSAARSVLGIFMGLIIGWIALIIYKYLKNRQ